MSGVEPAGEPTADQVKQTQVDSVRVHLALVAPEIVAYYIGAAAARLALDNGVSPREAMEQMLEGGAFTSPGPEWEHEKANLGRFTKLTRARFAFAAVQLYAQDASVN